MQHIDQTHEVMQQIDAQLNDYLASKGINNFGKSDHYDKLIQQSQQRNAQLQDGNQQIKKQIQQIQVQIQNIKFEYGERLNQKLQLQQIELSSQFEQKVSQFGEKARVKLMNTLQQEDQCLQQFNNLVNDKTLLQQQVEVKINQNEQITKEKAELEASYSNLLQMHNQLLQVDMSQNELSQSRSNVLGLLNNYKIELEQLKLANEKIQKQMGSELDQLKGELNKQKQENDILMQRIQLQEKVENENLYTQIFPQKLEITKKKRSKSNKHIKQNKNKLEHLEKELKRLQEIVEKKIQQKKQKIYL